MPDQPADDKTKTRNTPANRPSRSADAAARAAAAEAAAAPAKPAATVATEPAARPSRSAEAAAVKADAEVAQDAVGRDELRKQWRSEAQAGTSEHDKKVRTFLLRLSLLNWAIAIIAWTISAFLGITSPASIIVYSVLFVIGLVAAILAILTYLLEKFGHEAVPMGAISGDGGGKDDDAGSAAKADTAAPAAT